MPTAAKLISALALAVVLYVATVNYIPGLPEGTQVGWIREIAALTGLLCGWFVVGRKPESRLSEAISSGIKGAVVGCFWVLLVAAGYQMIRRALMMMYDGVIDAVLGVFERLIELGALLFTPGVAGVLMVGGGLVGVLARWSARRWT